MIIMELNISKNRIKNVLLNEYLFILLTIVTFDVFITIMSDYYIDDKFGIDGIGEALAIVIVFRILKYIVTFFVFIINPIRIIIQYKNEFKEINTKCKKNMYIILTLVPIIFSLLIILEIPISNYMYTLKYETGKNAYSLNYDEYKTPKDFERELDKRGFIYNAKFDLSRLNGKYKNRVNSLPEYYYENASVMPLFTKLSYFSDTKDYNDIITFDSNVKYPAYIYNTILYLYAKNESLQYAPISRYDGHTSLKDTFYPFYQDYYIECKILYVDNDMYAIIGVGQSYDIEEFFNKKKEGYSPFYTYPYNMIISEKKSITTFVNNKYYPEGAILNKGGKFEMVQNTNKREWDEPYIIREVEKLDIVTLNNIAEELQNGILKESIEYHFNKRNN